MQENKPFLIIGLGNPGTEYKSTRHNVGFMAADFLAGTDAKWKKEKNALVAKVENNKIFVKPQTFMNNSGLAVQSLMTFYKIPVENLIVIHDDMDLKIGNVRIKKGGGSGGHNGIKSIDSVVGPEYKRIRIGVGHPRDINSPIDPSDWVLGKFTKDELEKINTVITELNVL
jgi:PTH1 family peptidyl-tRNA hydrolase